MNTHSLFPHLSTKITLFALLALASAACSGGSSPGGTGTGGQGGQMAQGGNGGNGGNAGSSGTAGMGGMSSGTGGMGGSGGSGGGGGDACAGECISNADCSMPQPVCSKLAGDMCNRCFGACDGTQCMGQNTCVTDADCNASPDARCVCAENGCSICVLGFTGSPQGFPDVLDQGVWLIGWGGGLDHFSWLRFSFQTATTGIFQLLDAKGVTLTPYFPCEGSGSFSAQLGTGVLTLELPAACNMPKAYLDFESFFGPSGLPPHATMGANIQTMGQYINGFQHNASFCDMAFTTCGDPFQP